MSYSYTTKTNCYYECCPIKIKKKGTTLPKSAFEKLVSDLNYDLAKMIEKNILNYTFTYSPELVEMNEDCLKVKIKSKN